MTRHILEPQFQSLLDASPRSRIELLEWIAAIDTLEATIGQDFAWRYIAQTRDTSDQKAEASYKDFLQTIYPHWTTFSDKLWRKLLANESIDTLPWEYDNYIRAVRHGVAMFREENVALSTQEEELKSEFAKISGAWTIQYQGKELTMQEANDYLKSPDRAVRKIVFELMEERRKQDAQKLDTTLSQLIQVRTQIAQNCGFQSYTDYKYSYRYDYSKDQINEFHASIAQVITPMGKKFFDARKKILWLESLKPYDFDAPLFGEVQTELFSSTDQMIDKLCLLFHDMDPEFEQFIYRMKEKGYLDLETRKNKAPGGYNYPLAGSDYSFIFMNALRDSYGWFTWAHEAGHALHHHQNKDLSLWYFRDCPSEICEIASMAMELFTIDDLSRIGLNERQTKDALVDKLLKDLLFLPWMSQIDLFQQWMYDHPSHTLEERHAHRRQLNKQYPYAIRMGEASAWEGEYDDYADTFWQRQMHIFEVPFYYTEYGIAYLASAQLYNQWTENRPQAIQNYKNILSAWYVHSIPETMKLGQVEFDMSAEKLASLMEVFEKKYGELMK